jgi:hypothetical protein
MMPLITRRSSTRALSALAHASPEHRLEDAAKALELDP